MNINKFIPENSTLEEEKHQVLKREHEENETLKHRNKEFEALLLSKEREFKEEKEKNDFLKKEIDALKLKIIEKDQKFSPEKSGSSVSDDENEEIIALRAENQCLKKKLKELQSQAERIKAIEDENFEVKNKNIESQKQKLANISINLKENNDILENSEENDSKALLNYIKQIQALESTLKEVSMEIENSKQKLGCVINAAMEIGDPKFLKLACGIKE